MREIKFKIWDKQGNKFLESYDDGYVKIEYVLNTKGELFEWIESSEGGGDFMNELEQKNFIITQYTGVKDKRGKEIYEGDIVILNDSEEEYKCVVKYKYGSYILENRYFTEQLSNCEERFLEVIGNIYENRELLEE
ncbi:hypothetical protein EII29_07750 [Leptotrichia sp. OH3620_COT-345]|uniref:YopX family protein n=1 Tax=Leptotrichia sp. OH3620_COT-345 TaxID=2491048 RepID=UPI000F647CA7|nr:YopX family protein [Leptotrichia sp. OH3620_COT-345]RRD39292.1 hypothetical protein EII29_07750 [Leptotrichia sp. OH3620_COT-345]